MELLKDLKNDKPWIYDLLEPVSDSLEDFLWGKFIDLYRAKFNEDLTFHFGKYEHEHEINCLLADFYFSKQKEYVYFDSKVWHIGDVEDQLEAINNPIQDPYEIFSREEFEFIKKENK